MDFKKLRGHYTSIKDMREGKAKISYLMAKDGLVYENRINELGLFVAKAKDVYDLDEWQEGFKLALPKIPNKLLSQIISLFKYFYTNFKTSKEIMAQIFWDREKQKYFVYVPVQKVSSISVNADRNLELEQEHLLVLDIHSHPGRAFFSATDNNDEKETRLYAVVGNLKGVPEILLRASCAGKYIHLFMSDIFENADLTGNVSFPSCWINRASVQG